LRRYEVLTFILKWTLGERVPWGDESRRTFDTRKSFLLRRFIRSGERLEDRFNILQSLSEVRFATIRFERRERLIFDGLLQLFSIQVRRIEELEWSGSSFFLSESTKDAEVKIFI